MIISIVSYGAVPNDPSAAAVTRAAIQQAIDDVSLAGGGTVEVPDRADYWVEGGLIARNGVRLLGEGRHMAQIKLAPTVQAHLIDGINVEDFAIERLSLDGNREAFAKGGANVHGVRMSGSKRLRIIETKIRGAAYYGIGLQVSGSSPQPDIGYRIVDCEITECGGWGPVATSGDGIDIKYGRDGVIERTMVSQCAQRGIDVRGYNNSVLFNTVRQCGSTGITARGLASVNGMAIANPPEMLVMGNYVGLCGGDGVLIYNNDTSPQEGRALVMSNQVYSCAGYGVNVAGPTSKTRALIDGNLLRSNSMGAVNVPAGFTNVTVGTNRA